MLNSPAVSSYLNPILNAGCREREKKREALSGPGNTCENLGLERMIIWGICGLTQTYMDHLKVGLFYHLVPNPLLLLKVQPSALPSVLMFPGSRIFLIINS